MPHLHHGRQVVIPAKGSANWKSQMQWVYRRLPIESWMIVAKYLRPWSKHSRAQRYRQQRAARGVVGHAGADVTLKHYVQGPAIVARAFDRLGQPEAFQQHLPQQTEE